MILTSTPENQATLSNVLQVNTFAIKATAKSFQILSSGLYGNKIRAVIRELSCNAVDSHTAAGVATTPFDVHLPTRLEPWFAVRDYGTGLDHDQVTNIYTTYFESTKTGSNDFIGILGLGSKSPFSYTDNFTVTAIMNGRKGIYSAFIGDSGVPSIASMFEEESSEPTGVEIKFSVNDNRDIDKFAQEARTVYTHFSLLPVISGFTDFSFAVDNYHDRDIIPGVHYKKSGNGLSVAVMGNIGYPIVIPESDTTLGDLRILLNHNIELHFAIGELDFQASREGLSYIPQTINAIHNKLVLLNEQLTVSLTNDADKIENMWERAVFLHARSMNNLWAPAAKKYVEDNKFPLLKGRSYSSGIEYAAIQITEAELVEKYNISINGFYKTQYSRSLPPLIATQEKSTSLTSDGKQCLISIWNLPVGPATTFVTNESKIGASAKAKYHWLNANTKFNTYQQSVFIVEPSDKSKPADFVEFFKAIYSPPNVVAVTSLLEKPKASQARAKNVTILKLVNKEQSCDSNRDPASSWRDAGKVSDFDDTTVHYYLPLSGYSFVSKYMPSQCSPVTFTAHALNLAVIQSNAVCIVDLYGVRKSDIAVIETKKNWINFEDYLSKTLIQTCDDKLKQFAVNSIDFDRIKCYNVHAGKLVGIDSPYYATAQLFSNFSKNTMSKKAFTMLMDRYAPSCNTSNALVVEQITNELIASEARYPLLSLIADISWKSDRAQSLAGSKIADYIKLVDASSK